MNSGHERHSSSVSRMSVPLLVCDEADAHARSRRATAWAASPSPRPVNPRRSVVVARTFTRSASSLERSRQAASHLVAVRGDPRLLAEEHAVGIDELEPGLPHLPVRLREQAERVGAAEALVVGWEERADVAEPCRAEKRVGQRVRDDVPVGVAGEAVGMVDAHTAEHERDPRLEGVGVHTDADAKVAHGSRLAVGRDISRPDERLGERREIVDDERGLAEASAAAAPRGLAARGSRRDRRLPPARRRCRRGRRRTQPRRACDRWPRRCPRRRPGRACGRRGWRTPSDDVGRQIRPLAPSSRARRSGCRRDRRAAPSHGRDSRQSTASGIQVVRACTRSRPTRVGRSIPRWRHSPKCSSPRAMVTAERRPDDVRTEPDRARHLAPVALLVDERLADVEEDRLQSRSHDSTRARSSRVVTLSSRGSPGTTLMRPPARSTSDAQSVAPARSPA